MSYHKLLGSLATFLHLFLRWLVHWRSWRSGPQRRLARNASDPDRSVEVGEKLAGQIADG